MTKKKVWVFCTGNSCRSQLTEDYLKHFAGDKTPIYSAGIEIQRRSNITQSA